MAKKLLINGNEYAYELKTLGANVEVTIEGKSFSFSKNELCIANDGKHFVFKNKDYFVEKPSGKKRSGADEGGSISPMPGKILKVLESSGDEVKKGDPLIIMEAMKMEHTLKASQDGKVKTVKYSEGDLVEGQVELVELES